MDAQQQKISMLSVDDKSLVTDLDRAGYRKMGISVYSAASLGEMQACLKKRTIDVIVINYDYRVINWQDMRSLLDQEFANIPVVFTGVRPTPEAKKKAESLGASLFIEQPVPRPIFVEEVRKLLDRLSRTNVRVEVNENAKVYFSSMEFSAVVKDVSVAGLLLRIDHGSIQPGSHVIVDFVLGNLGKRIIVHGDALRSLMRAGEQCIAVKITSYEGDSEATLKKLVEKSHKGDDGLQYYI